MPTDPKPPRPSVPNANANASVSAHEIRRQSESVGELRAALTREQTTTNQTFVALGRHMGGLESELHDMRVAQIAIAKACGVEKSIPPRMIERSLPPAPPANGGPYRNPEPPIVPSSAQLPTVGRDVRQARLIALLSFGTGLIELALELLRHGGH